MTDAIAELIAQRNAALTQAEDAEAKLDAVTALADGPLTVDAHLRSANGDLFIDAATLRRALAGTDTDGGGE